MKPIEIICDRDRQVLLQGYAGVPAQRLEGIIESFGLRIAHENLGFREGAIDLRRGLIIVNTRLPELCDPRTDLHGVRNSILAHELGHWRLHRNLIEAGQVLTQVHENQAYTYAEEFLLPRDQLRARPEVWEMARARKGMKSLNSDSLWYLVEGIANHFEVSRSAVAFRLSRLNLLARKGHRLSLVFKNLQSSGNQTAKIRTDTVKVSSSSLG